MEYTKSQAFLAGEGRIFQNTIDTRREMREKEQYEMLSKTNEQLANAEAEMQVAEINALNPTDASSVIQISAYNDQLSKLNEAKKQAIDKANDSIVQKQSIMDNTYSIEKHKVQQNKHDNIQNFLREYPQYQTVEKDYSNYNIKSLRTFSLAYQN